MAEFLVVVCAFLIVAAFLALGVVIFNLGVLERRAMLDISLRSPLEIPTHQRVGVQNPFKVEVGRENLEDGFISLLLQSSVPCYLTLYWGVPVASIERSLCKEEQIPGNDYDDDENDDENDDTNYNETQFLPIHRVLSGSYESKGAMDFYEPGQNHQIKHQIPAEFLDQLECGQSNTISRYPLVVVTEWSRNIGPQQNVNPCDIVSLLTAIKYIHSVSGRTKFVVEAQFIQIASGRIYPLKKLFVTTGDTTESTNENQESTCVVCHSMPVSRVLLPCRHACVCGSCFSKLELKCPMCRQWIQSYFLTQEEPELAQSELDTSRELHRITDIVTGIFNSD